MTKTELIKRINALHGAIEYLYDLGHFDHPGPRMHCTTHRCVKMQDIRIELATLGRELRYVKWVKQ